MVTWWKYLRVILMALLGLGVSFFLVYLYETSNYGRAIAYLVLVTITATLVALWIDKINDNINRRSGE